jgi:hypothetical protein
LLTVSFGERSQFESPLFRLPKEHGKALVTVKHLVIHPNPTMAAETSPEDAAAAASPAAEAIVPAPVALQTEEETASTTILEKGKLRNSESDNSEMRDAETDATAESVNEEKPELDAIDPKAIVSSSKRSRPLYKFDPDKITLRFLFANRDGLTVTLECLPHDTVAEVKAALMSVWPEGKFYITLVGEADVTV